VLSDYTPMAATQVREPFHRDGWVYEEKVDGWRMLAYKDGARVRLVSRNGRDHTRRFAGIVSAIATLPARSLVLDGEAAIYDEKLRSRFDWLREPDADAVATPPVFMAFDLLTRTGASSPAARSTNGAPGWRTPSPVATSYCPCGGSRQMVSKRGRRWSSAATRAWSPRTRPVCTSRGRRNGG
jgi:ATP dependent DNA ligase-like protein